MLSYANEPEITSWPVFGEFVVNPGASEAIWSRVRATGETLESSRW